MALQFRAPREHTRESERELTQIHHNSYSCASKVKKNILWITESIESSILTGDKRIAKNKMKLRCKYCWN